MRCAAKSVWRGAGSVGCSAGSGVICAGSAGERAWAIRIDVYKRQLQEIIQQNPEEELEYVLTDESGPDHDKSFTVEVHLNSNIIGCGTGRSKKLAEQAAAREALALMGL